MNKKLEIVRGKKRHLVLAPACPPTQANDHQFSMLPPCKERECLLPSPIPGNIAFCTASKDRPLAIINPPLITKE